MLRTTRKALREVKNRRNREISETIAEYGALEYKDYGLKKDYGYDVHFWNDNMEMLIGNNGECWNVYYMFGRISNPSPYDFEYVGEITTVEKLMMTLGDILNQQVMYVAA